MFGIRFVVPLVLCSMACSSAPSAPGGNQPLPVVRLQPESFSFTYSSDLRESQRLVVRDQGAWQEVWTSIWRTHTPVPPLPAIDFSQDMIVVAALGERVTGGFSIFVDSATEGPAGVTVAIRSVSPATGCGVTLALTQPVDIARLPRRNGAISFDERGAVLACQ
jgi:PrcB C-terminal